MTTRNPNLNRLLEEWRHLYKRYGMKRLPPELEQLQLSLRRRKTRMEHIRAEIAELEARLEDPRNGIGRGGQDHGTCPV